MSQVKVFATTKTFENASRTTCMKWQFLFFILMSFIITNNESVWGWLLLRPSVSCSCTLTCFQPLVAALNSYRKFSAAGRNTNVTSMKNTPKHGRCWHWMCVKHRSLWASLELTLRVLMGRPELPAEEEEEEDWIKPVHCGLEMWTKLNQKRPSSTDVKHQISKIY